MGDHASIIPPVDYTAMDTSTLRRVITDMLQELRDQAIGTHKQATCYVRWKFIDVQSSSYSFDYNTITTNYKDNGGLPSRWDESALENLYRGLTDGRVQAIALDEVKSVLGESVVPPLRESGTKITSKRTRLPHKLRDRLIEVIETAIGRPLDQRSAKQIDPRKSDPHPPNSYKWQFSDEYPEFPDRKGGISRWHADQIHACYEALDQGYLTVVNVDAKPTEARQSRDDSAGASTRARSSISRVTETPSITGLASSHGATIEVDSVRVTAKDANGRADPLPVSRSFPQQSAQISNLTAPLGPPRGLDELQAQMLGMLNTALKTQAEELENTWKDRHESELSQVREALTKAEESLQKECASHRETLGSLLAMQRDGEKQRIRIAHIERELRDRITTSKTEDDKLRARMLQLEQELDEKVALARAEGRQSMSDEILKDLDRTTEGERLAVRRHHVEQLGKVRAESYQSGFKAGKSDAASSLIASPVVTAQIEDLKEQHLKELESARHVGREMAYTELSLGYEERASLLLHKYAEPTSNRKVRELRTIYQNWHDIPQRVLPSHMLPEGHIPGDKTLYLLAKLSKEIDADTASQLLSQEITKRCSQNPGIPSYNVVANSDIRNVLDRLNPTILEDRSSSQMSADLSQQSLSFTQGNPGESLQPRKESRRISPSVIRSKEVRRTASDHGHPSQGPKPLPSASKPEGFEPAPRAIRQGVELKPAAPSKTTNGFRTPELSLEDFLKRLPAAKIQLPNPLQSFSFSFLREKIGGGEFAFSKVGALMLKKQIVPWPEVIRIIPEHQRFAPKLGRHGALTFVSGRPGCGEVGKTYATLFRQSKERFLYIGHYTLTSKQIVSLEEWKAWPEEEKVAVARDIRDTNWGETLLIEKCLKTLEELKLLNLKEYVDEILKFFNRESEPNLRMTWSILRLDEFRSKGYDVLKSARTKAGSKISRKVGDVEPNGRKDLQNVFTEAAKQFLGGKESRNLTLNLSSDFTAAKTSRELIGKTVEQVHAIFAADAHKFCFFGMFYVDLVQEMRKVRSANQLLHTTSQNKSSLQIFNHDTRAHIIDWAREAFIGRLQSVEQVLFALYLMLTIYDEQEARILREKPDRRVSAPPTTRNTLTASTRPLLVPRDYVPDHDSSDSDEILYTNPKRRKTTSFTFRPLRTSQTQRVSGTLHPSIELNGRGSTIVVDLDKKEKDSSVIKKDDEGLNDDLYSAD